MNTRECACTYTGVFVKAVDSRGLSPVLHGREMRKSVKNRGMVLCWRSFYIETSQGQFSNKVSQVRWIRDNGRRSRCLIEELCDVPMYPNDMHFSPSSCLLSFSCFFFLLYGQLFSIFVYGVFEGLTAKLCNRVLYDQVTSLWFLIYSILRHWTLTWK